MPLSVQSEQSYFELCARRVQSNPCKVSLNSKIVWVGLFLSAVPCVKSCIMENDPIFWCSVWNSKIHLIEKLSDTPKIRKILFCLSYFIYLFFLIFQIGGKRARGVINDLIQEEKASKWLWASCPTAYMFNDAHQNFAFHYLNIKLELHEHSHWLLRIMFKHVTKHRWVDSKWRP